MSDDLPSRIAIRHLSGAAAREVEEFTIAGRDEIRIGSEPSQDVVAQGAPAVAASHAVIRIVAGEKPTFRLEGAGGAGVYLNGVRLSQPTELLPGDEIALGEGGPKLAFDLTPRPAYLGSRAPLDPSRGATGAAPLAPIEAVAAAEAPPSAPAPAPVNAVLAREAAPAPAQAAMSQRPAPAPAEAVAQAPVAAQGKMDWTSALVVVAGLAAIGLGGLFWQRQSAEAPAARSGQETAIAPPPAAVAPRAGEPAPLRLGPEEIARRHGDATARIVAHWRLYDKIEDRPIFIKVFKQDGVARPLFVELPNKSVLPWLTLDGRQGVDAPVSGTESGTGFAVSPDGFVLTSKAATAGWSNAFGACHCREEKGWLVRFGDLVKNGQILRAAGRKTVRVQAAPIDLGGPGSGEAYLDWIPASGGVLLDGAGAGLSANKGANPVAVADKRAFVGKNESIEAIFPQAGDLKGEVAKTSEQSDAALVKIATPRPLPTAPLAAAGRAPAGEKLVVLGYSTDAAPTIAVGREESRRGEALAEAPPRAFLVETKETVGEAMRLEAGSQNPGDRGAPLFDAKGEVVGIYAAGGALATPIEFGRELLPAERR